MVANIRDMTVEAYLAFDDASDIRNEYIDGAIIPMAGGTRTHNKMVAFTIAELISSVGDKHCEVLDGHMRVRIDDTRFVYPDVSVVCGEALFENEHETILLNPTAVAEVTSPSSIERDHVKKVEFYGAVPSIQVYLILDQERVFAECYTRAADGWTLRQYASRDDLIPLEALGCSLGLAGIYRGITFEA